MKAWLPEDAQEAMMLEAQMHPDETDEARARRVLREAGPAAAVAIVHVAQYGESSRVRLDASKYIIDRLLGKIGDDGEGEVDPVELLLRGTIKDVEAYANKEAGN